MNRKFPKLYLKKLLQPKLLVLIRKKSKRVLNSFIVKTCLSDNTAYLDIISIIVYIRNSMFFFKFWPLTLVESAIYDKVLKTFVL